MTDVAFHVTVTQDQVREAVREVIVARLKADTSFSQWVDSAIMSVLEERRAEFEHEVRETVKAQAPYNPNMIAIIDGVKEHLDRYPALQRDQGMQEVVGKAIFDYLQKTL